MEKQRAEIIDCTLQLLKECGGDSFSFSRVAAYASIEPTELQQHFSGKESLLSAAATSFLENQCVRFNSSQLQKSGTLQQELRLWLVELLQYRESDGCAALFKALWATALHNQDLYLLLDQYYRQLQQIVNSKLQSVAPENCPAQRIESAGCFLLSFIEGYGLMRATLPVSLLQLAELLGRSLSATLTVE